MLPLHPRTKAKMETYGLKFNFDTIDPVGYFDMLELIKNADLVLTDSGGLQKEAYFFDKYCITMRDETEWVELVENKVNQLVGADEKRILNAFSEFSAKQMDFPKGLYGEGDAAFKIVSHLYKRWGKGQAAC